MIVFYDIQSWIKIRNQRASHETLGFVPTMGNLHVGHLSLIERSQQENTQTIVTIFVNPTQFNQSEDFKNYPRTLEQDLKLLEDAGVDYCLIPSAEEIYHDQYQYQVDEKQYSQLLEGKSRPGHYQGVLTVVMKFFNLIKPTQAYFGEKDYQQYRLIKDMVSAFFMDLKIIVCPTIREQAHLAYSSRNNRPSEAGKDKAQIFAKIFHETEHQEDIQIKLNEANIEIDHIEDHDGRRFAAVFIDGVRLIDNYALKNGS